MSPIVPVIDVMGGHVVRAVGGRRELYEPLRSKLTPSIEPLAVAEALLAATGSLRLYVADIDAIQGHRPHLDWLRPLIDRGIEVLVDAGVRSMVDAIPVAAAGAAVVVGTETLRDRAELAPMVQAWDSSRILLSLDFRNGTLLGEVTDPLAVVNDGVAAGVRRFIVLELARVGTALGPGTLELIQSLSAVRDVELLAGGGVRNQADVQAILAAGAVGVLAASAIHDRDLA